MANRAAERFVKNLKASIGSWRMPADTEAIYIAKLSRWRLTDDEWSAALSRIISENANAELPPLAKIYEFLKRHQQAVAHSEIPLGHCMFTVNGKREAARVYWQDGKWMSMRVDKDPESRDWRMVRTDREFLPPTGCEDILYHLDDPKYAESKEEKQYPVGELVNAVVNSGEAPF